MGQATRAAPLDNSRLNTTPRAIAQLGNSQPGTNPPAVTPPAITPPASSRQGSGQPQPIMSATRWPSK